MSKKWELLIGLLLFIGSFVGAIFIVEKVYNYWLVYFLLPACVIMFAISCLILLDLYNKIFKEKR
jgi:hypothetical protein